jgi:CheY-like chemotaxis protein
MHADDVDILLVEDNPKDVELTLHALRRHNLANKVLVARDGQEALDFFFDGNAAKPVRPRLVLLDLKLPKVPGLEVLRRLKGNAQTRAIPVVILTSSTTEGDLAEGYRLGANSYVRKPIDFNEFVEAAKVLGMYWLLMNKNPP